MQKRMQVISKMKKITDIPNDDDWGDFQGDFDIQDAHGTFFGRSNREMHDYFAKDVMARAQDIRFMPQVPFMYYFLGFIDFVLSESYGDQRPSDVAASFISVVKDWANKDPSALLPSFDDIAKALDFLVDNQERFGADVDIYGDFREESALIKRLVTKPSRPGH